MADEFRPNLFDRLALAFGSAFKGRGGIDPGQLQPVRPPMATGYMAWPGWEKVLKDSQNQNFNDEASAKIAVTSHLVFKAISAISSELSTATLHVLERVREKDEEIINHPFELNWSKPNPHMGRSFLMQYWAWQLLLSGEAYLYFIPSANGKEIKEIWPIPSWFMSPEPHEKEFISGYVFKAARDAKPIVISPEFICYSRIPHPFDLRRGLSPLAALNIEIEGDLAMANWNKNFFGRDNATPTGLISVPRDTLDVDMVRIRNEIMDFFGSGQRRVAVARAGDVEWQPFDRSQRDMEFLTGRNYSEKAILTTFRIPEGFFAKDATRANAEGAKATFIENAVWPYLVMLQEDLNTQISPRYYKENEYIEFNDIRPRNRALELQEFSTLSAVLTLDELRARFKYDPIGDYRGEMLVAEIGKGTPMTQTPADKDMQEETKKQQAVDMAEAEKRAKEAEEKTKAMAAQAQEEKLGAIPRTSDGSIDFENAVIPAPSAGGAAPPAAEGETKFVVDDVLTDLERWQRKAIKTFKAKGKAVVPFSSEFIDQASAQKIQQDLAQATSVAAIKAAFTGALDTAAPPMIDPEQAIRQVLPDLIEWANDLRRAFLTPEEITSLAIRKLTRAVEDLIETGDLPAWLAEAQRIIVAELVFASIIGGIYHDVAHGLMAKPDNIFELITGDLFEDDRRMQDIIRARNRFENEQRFLRQFAWDIGVGRLTPKQIGWRMNLYAGAVKPAYMEALYGDWRIPENLLPGSHQCRYACQCEIVVNDNGDGTGLLTYVLGANKNHCPECVMQAGVHLIYRRRG